MDVLYLRTLIVSVYKKTFMVINVATFIFCLQAVCCSDHVHCCPNGYTCDVEHSTCKKGLMSQPWVKKISANPIEVRSVRCPGGKSSCPDSTTCCKLPSGKYGCCPMPNVSKNVSFCACVDTYIYLYLSTKFNM